jgi:spermidine synthase
VNAKLCDSVLDSYRKARRGLRPGPRCNSIKPRPSGETRIVAVVLATGIASVVTQLVLIREFLSQFQGNEIVIALILFSWLILGGIGTLLARPAAGTRLAAWQPLSALSMVLALLSTVTLLGARLLRDMLFVRGASVGFYPTFFYIFSVTSPYALLIGFLLPVSLFVLRSQRPDYPGTLVYIWDNLGDIGGGALFSFGLVFLMTPLQAIVAAHLPLLVAVLRLHPPGRRPGPARILAAAAVVLVMCGGLIAERLTVAPSHGELAHYRETRYGRITVVRQQELLTLFQDGTPALSSQDEAEAEEAVHYALAQIENPRRILMISAFAGVMEELEKYHLESIDYVELDPDLTEILFQYRLLKRIPGLRVVNEDGRAFLAAASSSYDAILVNIADPQTFQGNRFFTDRFFSLAAGRLSDRGVLSFSMPGYENYLSEPQRRKLSSLYRTVRAYFPHVLMLPGQRVFFICSHRPLRTDMTAALEAKGIPTLYISAYYDGDVTPERISWLRSRMDPPAPLNAELAPYLMRTVFSEWFAKFDTSPLWFMAVTAGLLGLYFFRTNRVEFVLFSTGWMTMGSEILVIFAFQIFFGYIYFQIGIIVTVFLAGLLPGALWGRRLVRRARSVLIVADVGLIGLLAVIFAAVHLGDRLPEATFLVLGFGISLACGLQFPAALYLRGDAGVAATGIFSADLIGAAFGTLVTSTVLIPYLGITGAIGGLLGLKLMSLWMAGTLHETPIAKTIPD